MKYFIGIRKADGLIVYYADGLNQVDETIFDQKEIEITDEEMQKIKDNMKIFYRNGQLEFEETPASTLKKTNIMRELARKKLMEKGENITQKELIDILNALLN